MRSNLSGVVSGGASRLVSRLISTLASSVGDRLARSRPAGVAAGAATILLALSTAAALGISSLLEKPGPPPAGGALSAGRNALQAALVVNAGADDPALAPDAAGTGFEGGALPSIVGGSDAALSSVIATLDGGRAAGDELHERSHAAAGSPAVGGRGSSSLLRSSLGGMMGTGLLAAAARAHRYSTFAMADTGRTVAVTPATPTDPLAGAPVAPADTSRATAPAGGGTASGDAGAGATKGPVVASDSSKTRGTSGKTPVVAPTVAVVTPEPGTLLLLGGGLVALGAVALRRRQRA